jgi:hypothetical protein
LEGDVFRGTPLQSISLPRSIEIIGDSCFANCHSLTEVKFAPDCRLHTLKSLAFYSSGLECVTVPRSLRSIGSGCFMGCKALEYVKFEPGSALRQIDTCAMSDCPRLFRCEFPPSVDFIDESVRCLNESRPSKTP